VGFLLGLADDLVVEIARGWRQIIAVDLKVLDSEYEVPSTNNKSNNGKSS